MMLLKIYLYRIIVFFLSLLLLTLFFQGIPSQPPEIDHAKLLLSLNNTTLEKGKAIYNSACIACHGKDGTASLPQARSFNKDKLRFGQKPFEMWKTISNGAGMMPAQGWLSAAERYYVIQYIREALIKKANPSQYFKITNEYLATLPRSKKSVEEHIAQIKFEALHGSLQYGQEWFMNNKSEYGNAIYSQLKGHSTSAFTVVLDDSVLVSYDLLRMRIAAVWQGNLNVSNTRYKRYRGEGLPFIEGKKLEDLGVWQWTYNNKFDSLNKNTGVREPLPSAFLDFHGHYKYGKDVILSYSVTGRQVFEYPKVLKQDNHIILSHTLLIGPGKKQEIRIGHLDSASSIRRKFTLSFNGKISSDSSIQGNIFFIRPGKTMKGKFMAAGIISKAELTCRVNENNDMILSFPASNDEIKVQVLKRSGINDKELEAFAAYIQKVSRAKAFAPLSAMIKGGPARWAKKVTTQGKLNNARPRFDSRYFKDEDKTIPSKLVTIPDDYPYTIDDIGLPFNNAYNSWIRPTALSFFDNGRLLVATYAGDVWMGTGIDSTLKQVTWQRIATGLYEPMGMKVIDNKIYVTCRNGITILRDLNGDNETDFYDNFYSDHDVSSFFHAFNFGLETDRAGNLYYVKPGQYTDNKDPGNVIKISPDGKKWESIATGFRVNNGITITPDDRIFVSDNQGNWTPANKLNFIQHGKYYGYVPNKIGNGWSPNGIKIDRDALVNGAIAPDIVPVKEDFEQPALWMPQELDNSPGGGVWSPKSWGPLGEQFIHTSYGKGWTYYFLPHEAGGMVQGAMVAMPFQFAAGIQRAVVNPVDKQIYVTGLTGWDDGVSTKYGVLSRIRYKGGKGHLLTDAEAVKGGIRLTFNFSLDKKISVDADSYHVSQWNYRRTSEYGSAHYSLKHPGTTGEDTVVVTKVIPGEDGRSVLLKLQDMSVVQTMRIRFHVKGADGATVEDAVYLTINELP